MKQYTLGLTGLASVGKDTVADLLVTHWEFRKLAFADALRGEVATAFGIDVRLLSDPATKNDPSEALALRKGSDNAFTDAVIVAHITRDDTPRGATQWAAFLDQPRSPRQIMQWWGTEYRRRQSPRYWTMQLAARITAYRRDGGTRFVITDCRFDNEVDTLRALGGTIWQVTRPGVDSTTTPEGQHVSVTDGTAFKPDAVIANTHDIRHLQQLVHSEFVTLVTGIPSAKVTVAEWTAAQ
ncbi:hypothetical protein [Acidovorax cavernicola]|uniref:Deoxynucleotide monophosphate kinase n=1 Tax=Acidovorax cavernicola TaxID=1675792 RepID=A0A9X8CZS6_9BURK|nr:hypothetical protein [Acidovorax cavernicola]RIX74448.1 hypothetical protein D3H34_27335 [Acidovorax cavernicola]